MKTIIMILALIFTVYTYSQNEVKDTLFMKKNSTDNLTIKNNPYYKDIVKLEENYILSVNKVKSIKLTKPKRQTLIKLNTYLTENVYQYSKGIFHLRNNSKLSFSKKDRIEEIYTSILEESLFDFAKAISILKNENWKNASESSITFLQNVEQKMKIRTRNFSNYNIKIKE